MMITSAGTPVGRLKREEKKKKERKKGGGGEEEEGEEEGGGVEFLIPSSSSLSSFSFSFFFLFSFLPSYSQWDNMQDWPLVEYMRKNWMGS